MNSLISFLFTCLTSYAFGEVTIAASFWIAVSTGVPLSRFVIGAGLNGVVNMQSMISK